MLKSATFLTADCTTRRAERRELRRVPANARAQFFRWKRNSRRAPLRRSPASERDLMRDYRRSKHSFP
jgi:hypothetical protein